MGKRTLWFLCGAVSILASTTGFAQVKTDDSASDSSERNLQGLAEVTVTARKRTESVRDVPVAVSTISQAQLENNVVNDVQTMGELVPQVSIGRVTGGTGAVITIRGISSSAVDPGLEQSVSMSVDGVSLSRGRVLEASQFDLQQVEVLEGPQALFFGKNSPAGVISISSADPTSHFDGYAKGGYEFEAKERFGEVVVSGPITSDLKARLAVRYDNMDGWITNNAPAEANPFQPFAPLPGAADGEATRPAGHDVAGRLTMLWNPTDNFDARLKATFSGQRLNGNASDTDTFCTNGVTVPSTLGVPQTHANCNIDRIVTISNWPSQFAANFPYANGGVPFARSDVGLGSLTLNQKLDAITLTSTTGYYDQNHSGSFDADYGEFAQIYDAEDERYRLFNEEFRANTDFAGPVNAMAGLYYEYSERPWINTPGILNIFNPVANNYATVSATSMSHSDSYSAFAQLRWKIVPSLELSGGARYSYDNKRMTAENVDNNPFASSVGVFLYPDGVPLSVRYTGNNVSPEATLSWKPDRDQTLYAAYKTGYKSGGISNGIYLDAGATAQNLLFGPEKARGFEAGYKAELLNDTLRLDLVAYRYNYDGLQVTALGPPPSYNPSIRNAAAARTTGVQGSFEFAPINRLTFDGNVGFNHARYLSFPDAPCYASQTAVQGCLAGGQDLSGRPLNRAPNVTFKLGGDYKAVVTDHYTADMSLSGAYSTSYFTATDYGPGGFQPSFWLLNAALNITAFDKYRLSVIGRNLTNSFYMTSTFTAGLGSPFQYNGFFNRPREVVLQLQYNFGK